MRHIRGRQWAYFLEGSFTRNPGERWEQGNCNNSVFSQGKERGGVQRHPQGLIPKEISRFLTYWASEVSSLALTSCMILGKSLHFSEI